MCAVLERNQRHIHERSHGLVAFQLDGFEEYRWNLILFKRSSFTWWIQTSSTFWPNPTSTYTSKAWSKPWRATELASLHGGFVLVRFQTPFSSSFVFAVISIAGKHIMSCVKEDDTYVDGVSSGFGSRLRRDGTISFTSSTKNWNERPCPASTRPFRRLVSHYRHFIFPTNNGEALFLSFPKSLSDAWHRTLSGAATFSARSFFLSLPSYSYSSILFKVMHFINLPSSLALDNSSFSKAAKLVFINSLNMSYGWYSLSENCSPHR